MNNSMAITGVSMFSSMERLNVVGHNLANANTTGYKRDIMLGSRFDTQLAENLVAFSPGGINGATSRTSLVKDMSAGSMRYTGGALDMAIEGKGFFTLINGGEYVYSRDGRFERDSAGRLVNSKGLPVAGQSGEIRLPEGEIFIDARGQIWQGNRVIDELRVVDFAKPEYLEKRGAGLYVSNGYPEVSMRGSESARIRQGYLETSNVAVMKEMVDLMSVVRHFEMSRHVISGYDEMIGKAIEQLANF